jgi:hypothetical protein
LREAEKTGKIDLTSLSSRDLRKHFDAVASRAAKRVLAQHPQTLAIGVNGSVARGQPNVYSDIDLFAIMPPGKRPARLSYLDSGCYVIVYFLGLRKDASPQGIDFFWARGGALSTRILYDPRHILTRQIKFRKSSRPSKDSLESILLDSYSNTIEYAGKLRNGWRDRDEYLTRYAARIIAERSQNAVIALNNISPMSENLVWHQTMRARKKPRHFKTDYPIAYGLVGTNRTQSVFSSGLRLARETLELIRKESTDTLTQRNFRALLAQPLETLGL